MCTLELRNVANETGECRRARKIDLRDRHLDRELAPVATHPRQLDSRIEVNGMSGLEVASEATAVIRSQRRRHDELGHVLTDGVVARIAKDPLGRRIELENAALRVHRDDAVEGGAQDCAGQRFPCADSILSTAAYDELADQASKHGHRRKKGANTPTPKNVSPTSCCGPSRPMLPVRRTRAREIRRQAKPNGEGARAGLSCADESVASGVSRFLSSRDGSGWRCSRPTIHRKRRYPVLGTTTTSQSSCDHA